jgi:hypothetical protein
MDRIEELSPSAPQFLVWIFALLMLLVVVGSLVVWIWALVDCIRVPDDRYYRAGTKLVWVLVIIFLQLIGAIVYLAVGRPDKATLAGPPPAGAMPPPPPP